MRRGRRDASVDVDVGNRGSGREGNGTGLRSAGERSATTTLIAAQRRRRGRKCAPRRIVTRRGGRRGTSARRITATRNNGRNQLNANSQPIATPHPKTNHRGESSQTEHAVEALPARVRPIYCADGRGAEFFAKPFPVRLCAAGPHARVAPVLLHRREHEATRASRQAQSREIVNDRRFVVRAFAAS